jgi:hypothetical protein
MLGVMAQNNWHDVFNEALAQRYEWLSSSEIPKLHESLCSYQTAFTSLYEILLKKRIVNEDPYKNETKVTDLVMPEIGPLPEANKLDQFSLRLANYDNQLDYITNFYTLSVETLRQDKIKILLTALKFIDWQRLTPDSYNHNTRAMAEIITKERYGGGNDPVAMKTMTENIASLEEATSEITSLLKEFSDYNREAYKGAVRERITAAMTAAEATIANIKKKFPSAFDRRPFYTELIEELIREDFAPDAETYQKQALKRLAVEQKQAASQQENTQQVVVLKPILIAGINALGASGQTLQEVLEKTKVNQEVYRKGKKSLGEKLKEFLAKLFAAEVTDAIYECDWVDLDKGPIKEHINLNTLGAEVETKCRLLKAVVAKGPAMKKLESMTEKQLLELLENNLRAMQGYHRQFSILDDFFKNKIDKAGREKVKGIKPELATIKSAASKAAAKRAEYTACIEEAEQFKRLGIPVAASTMVDA